MDCPNCKSRNTEGARFCSNCGSSLQQFCSNCGTELQAGARFCHNCGHPVEAKGVVETGFPSQITTISDTRTFPRSQQVSGHELHRYLPKELLHKLESARANHIMAGERRIVTILFCDVKGSTEAAAELDPEEWAEIINGAFEHMIRPVYRYEGTVARLQGDGLLAFFGAPIAHEDDPQRAVLTGLEIIELFKGYAAIVKDRWGIDFAVRVGINTGMVVVGAVGSDLRVEYSALGDAINLAARMEQTALPGTVQIAEPTHKLIAPLFNFEEIKELIVKGREKPVRAFRVISQKVTPGSLRGIAGLEAPLTGRQVQLDELLSAFQDLLGGRSHIISVVGEAGLGKTRLISEFKHKLMMEWPDDFEWLEGHSVSYDSSTPFAPFNQILSSTFRLDPGLPHQDNLDRIIQYVESILPGQGLEISPFFAAMLGIPLPVHLDERVKYMEPQQLRGLIFKHVVRLIDTFASKNSVILFLDDLHWADPTSLELLLSLLTLTERVPLMVLTAFRPQKNEISWHFHEDAARNYGHRYRMIPLSPLDSDSSRDLVARLLHVENLTDTVRKKILQKSEGNPFYMEELIRSLMDKGMILRANGQWQVTKEIQEITIPDSLIAVITARLDRLSERSQQVIQAAAVLGREFSLEVLAEVMNDQEELESVILELLRKELVVEKNRYPLRTYIFKHVLTQEAAYQSILQSNRREMHGRAAKSLVARNSELVSDIARHFLEAKQTGNAVPYLVMAGDKASKAYAVDEAARFYRQVIDMRNSIDDPDSVRRAYEGLGDVLRFTNRIPEAQHLYQEMLEVAESLGNTVMQISALNKLSALIALYFGQFNEAEPLLARAEMLSNSLADRAGLSETSLIRCQMCAVKADFDGIAYYMNDLVEVGQSSGSLDFIAVGLEHLASSLTYMTRFDEAFEKAKEGLRVSREIGNKAHEADLLTFPVPMYHIRMGNLSSAEASLHEGLDIAMKIGSLGTQTIAGYLLAEISRWKGEYELALHYGQISLNAALPIEPFLPYLVVPILGSMGMIYLEISELYRDKVGEFHLHALRMLEDPTAAFGGGTAWADLGLCALTMGDRKLAEDVFQKGLNYPNMFMRLERPRHLSGSAVLAAEKGELDLALDLIGEGEQFASERSMRHIYPLMNLMKGKILGKRGENQKALAALEKAEIQAAELRMRPIVWQARAGQADIFVQGGKMEAANEKFQSAKKMVNEIAELFENPDLKDAFLKNAMGKLRVSLQP